MMVRSRRSSDLILPRPFFKPIEFDRFSIIAHYTYRVYRAEILQERLESRLELLGRDWVGICPFKRDTFKRTYPFKEATANIKQIC